MTIKPYLRVYTGSDMHYRFDEESEEWYNDRDMRYFDRYDYSDEESEEEDMRYDSNETRGKEAATQDQAPDSSDFQNDNSQQPRDDTTGHEETRGGKAEPTTETDTKTAYQAQTQTQYDLSYYGYGDYDFGQLSRVTTAFNMHDFMDPSPSAAEDRDNEGDDEGEEDEEEEDAEDVDDMSMANRRWHCPRPQR